LCIVVPGSQNQFQNILYQYRLSGTTRKKTHWADFAFAAIIYKQYDSVKIFQAISKNNLIKYAGITTLLKTISEW